MRPGRGGVPPRPTTQTKDAAASTKSSDLVPALGTTLTFNLFDDVVVTGIVERTAPTFSGGYSVAGHLVEEPLGTLTLVVNGETVAGTVRTVGETYHIRSVGDGLYAISEVEEPPLNCGVDALHAETDHQQLCPRRPHFPPILGAHGGAAWCIEALQKCCRTLLHRSGLRPMWRAYHGQAGARKGGRSGRAEEQGHPCERAAIFMYKSLPNDNSGHVSRRRPLLAHAVICLLACLLFGFALLSVGATAVMAAAPGVPTDLSAAPGDQAATLSDPDGEGGSVTWGWARSSDQTNWTNISGATEASYTPTNNHRGMYLRATATYTDGEGSGKTAEAVSDYVVSERAPAPKLTVSTLVSGLTIPWGVAFTPDGTMLFTERGGKLSSRLTDGTVQTVSADISDLYVSGEAGLMAIVVDPDFASNRRFYTCQGHTGPEVQVIAWTFDDDTYTTATRANDPLVGNIPAASRHSGCRLRFGPQGYLWIATGDAAAGTTPQDLTSLGGKVLRVDASTGAGAPGNPFASSPLIYTYGHRNVQGLALRPGTSQMWAVEHGPWIDDEINLLVAGGNHGWDPVPGYDESVPMTDLVQFPSAIEAKWASGDPTLATSGGIFLEGDDWGEWEGRLAVATLKKKSLRVFEFADDGTFVSQVVVPKLDNRYGRLRTPMLGPDGALYVSTSKGNGKDKILKVVPSEAPTFPATAPQAVVDENSSPSTVVTTVTAIDPDGDPLTYTLSGPDAAAFDIDPVGQITVGEETVLDHKTKPSYEIIVTATDRYGLSDSLTVTITVSDVNEVPTFPAATATRILSEDAAPGQALAPPVTATDDDNDPLTYTLDPASEPFFTIDKRTGQMRTEAELDYETQPHHFVTVRVSDGMDAAGNADLTVDATLAVTVTVTDAPGKVTLSSTRPQVGSALTATLHDDPDGVDTATTEWCWERSLLPSFPPTDTREIACAFTPTTTATYTPVDDDLGYYLRATARYTDGQGTAKPEPAAGGTTGTVSACAEDLHGNSAAQSTDIALSAVAAGAICPAADVDYLTVTAPGRGLLFVDTPRGVPTRGTIWQDGVVLATGPTGRQPDDRLGARVQAGPIVVAVQGQGGATGTYAVEITFVQGYLENPGPDSFQSGVGLLSGWVCEAAVVELELNGVPQEAAYGTERLDTAGVCGDTDNGFGLLFNWNLLGDGEHTVVAFVDGVELDQASVTVTTLGQEFLRGVTGTCEAEDFPTLGERVTLVWQQNSQNFVIAGGSPPAGAPTGRTSTLTGFLENPGHNSFQSGVRVLSGWVCDADTVELAIGTAGRQVAAYGTERLDTAGVCGDTDNGFGLLFNWNLLGEGEHDVVAYVDGIELGRATVRVTTLGQEFLRGVVGECMAEDFPMLGETVTLEWQQNSQNFVITDVE